VREVCNQRILIEKGEYHEYLLPGMKEGEALPGCPTERFAVSDM